MMPRTLEAPAVAYAPSRTEQRAGARAGRAAAARSASVRRRFVDPSTCDRDYTASEVEFMRAIQAYKQSSGRMFPTWSEVLEVLQGLGYEQPGAGAGR